MIRTSLFVGLWLAQASVQTANLQQALYRDEANRMSMACAYAIEAYVA